MRRIQPSIRLLAVGTLLSGLISGCSSPKGNDLGPADHCRIQRVSTIYPVGDNSLQTDYTYNDQGQLTNRTKVSQSSVPTGSDDKTVTSDSYMYDAAGFLSHSVTDVHQTAQFVGKPTEYHYISTTHYTYTNERLSSLTRTDVTYPQQRTVVTSLTYHYDSAGQLHQIISQDGVGSTTYQDGKEQTSTMSGDIHFELQDGLMVKATFPGTDASGASQPLVQLNQYDTQRRLIKHEEYLNGQLDSYYTQEYEAGKPAEASLPAFKGHPVIAASYGEPGLLSHYQAYSANKQHQLVQYMEQRYEHQLNAQGFVTATRQTNQLLTNGMPSPSIVTSRYTYAGCP